MVLASLPYLPIAMGISSHQHNPFPIWRIRVSPVASRQWRASKMVSEAQNWGELARSRSGVRARTLSARKYHDFNNQAELHLTTNGNDNKHIRLRSTPKVAIFGRRLRHAPRY